MPFTPFHFGPGLLISLTFLSFIDIPTFLIASVIIDVEPFLVLVFQLNYPLHGFFHSFLGGFIVAVLLTMVMSKIRRYFTPLLTFFKLEQSISFKKIFFSSTCAIFLHILLDSPMYLDIRPFFPFEFNPFYRSTIWPGLSEYLICVWCFVGAILVYIIRLLQHKIKIKKPPLM
ncbi:MAG TPA: hypothetical protein VMV43_00780 [Candidatus Nanopelagicaceae bacterium]|nr:hypothetical protein [Candidatus Nanopelagicaceae bacterium]